MPPADWFPERADTEYEFRWLFDIDNDASTGLKVDGVNGLGADIVAEIKFDSGKGIEAGHAYRPALNAGETNSVVIPELYFGSVQEGMSNLKIGKALFTSFDGNRGPYSGADPAGFTFRMDYRGAKSEQFPPVHGARPDG